MVDIKRKIIWSAKLAYAVGLIATDGSLSKDGRHIIFVSKDLQLIKTFCKCLNIVTKISNKASGFTTEKRYYYIQFSNVQLYQFLSSLGLTPAKSKTMKAIIVPKKYFFDFLRGSFDGDGNFYSYWDKRWKSSFLYYLCFSSASKPHVEWLQKQINESVGLNGSIGKKAYSKVWQLRYAKTEARVIIKKMYHNSNSPRLERKYKKVYTALAI
jgi:hypothetical protein